MIVRNPVAALLVVDMQAGLFSGPGPELHQPEALLSRLAALIARARARDVPVVYTRFLGPPGSPLEAEGAGSRIHPDLAPEPRDLVIPREDSDAFLRTDLHVQLGKRGVEDLVVCGLQSEFCVDTTCRTAYALGYRVFLVRDGHSTRDAGALTAQQIIEHHNQTLGSAYGTLCSTEDLFR